MSETVTIPESLHLCPRCGDLASGAKLCEDCVALQELGRRLDAGLRRELCEYRWGKARSWARRVVSLLAPVLAAAGSVAVLAYVALKCAEAAR